MKSKIDLIKFLPERYIKQYTKFDPKWIEPITKNQFHKPVKVKRFLVLDKNLLYNLGLWSGDKYVYGGSVGLTNIKKELINEFEFFLKKIINESTAIRKIKINNGTALRVFVNSWLVLRTLNSLTKELKKLIKTKQELFCYLSGLIDADGTIMPNNKKYNTGLIKITYGDERQIQTDLFMCKKFGLNCFITKYKNRNAFDLKFTQSACFLMYNKLFLRHKEKIHKIMLIGKLARR